MSAQAAPAKITKQIAQSNVPVLFKLGLFTAALGLGPLTAFYGSQKYLWEGNSTYAAITAIVAANFVLFVYIVASIREDQGAQKDEKNVKKNQ